MTDKHCGHECVRYNFSIDLSTVPKKTLMGELAKREGVTTEKCDGKSVTVYITDPRLSNPVLYDYGNLTVLVVKDDE